MVKRVADSYSSKSKGNKKKLKENRFSRYKSYNLTTNYFPVTNHGQTAHPKPRTKIDINQFLIGRTFSVNQADLEAKDSSEAATGSYRYFQFKVNRVLGNDCKGVFNGMFIKREKLNSTIRKRHTLISVECEITTSDESRWRILANATTVRKNKSTSISLYAKKSEIKEIRKLMVEKIKKVCDGVDVNQLVRILSNEGLSKDLERVASHIYPVAVILHKVNPIKNMTCTKAFITNASMADNQQQQQPDVVLIDKSN